MKSFMFGTAAGVLLCLGVQWLLLSYTQKPSTAEAELQTLQQTEEQTTQRPNIDFYTRLRDSEVLVPEPQEIEPRSEVVYVLQAASFRNKEDADRARAQLILLNLEANVTEFHNNGETWHRLMVGPFQGQSALSKAQTTLLENGYAGMVLQRNK